MTTETKAPEFSIDGRTVTQQGTSYVQPLNSDGAPEGDASPVSITSYSALEGEKGIFWVASVDGHSEVAKSHAACLNAMIASQFAAEDSDQKFTAIVGKMTSMTAGSNQPPADPFLHTLKDEEIEAMAADVAGLTKGFKDQRSGIKKTRSASIAMAQHVANLKATLVASRGFNETDNKMPPKLWGATMAQSPEISALTEGKGKNVISQLVLLANQDRFVIDAAPEGITTVESINKEIRLAGVAVMRAVANSVFTIFADADLENAGSPLSSAAVVNELVTQTGNFALDVGPKHKQNEGVTTMLAANAGKHDRVKLYVAVATQAAQEMGRVFEDKAAFDNLLCVKQFTKAWEEFHAEALASKARDDMEPEEKADEKAAAPAKRAVAEIPFAEMSSDAACDLVLELLEQRIDGETTLDHLLGDLEERYAIREAAREAEAEAEKEAKIKAAEEAAQRDAA